MSGVSAPSGRRFKNKRPEQHPRQNCGPRLKAVDAATVQRYSRPDDPMFLPQAKTPRPQSDFPVCSGCLSEFRILQDAPGAERQILCPKSPVRLKNRQAKLAATSDDVGPEDAGLGDWTPVPSRLAKGCDGRGSAAAAAAEAEAKQAADQSSSED